MPWTQSRKMSSLKSRRRAFACASGRSRRLTASGQPGRRRGRLTHPNSQAPTTFLEPEALMLAWEASMEALEARRRDDDDPDDEEAFTFDDTDEEDDFDDEEDDEDFDDDEFDDEDLDDEDFDDVDVDDAEDDGAPRRCPAFGSALPPEPVTNRPRETAGAVSFLRACNLARLGASG